MNRIDNLKKRHFKRAHENHWAICSCVLAREIRSSIVLDVGLEAANQLILKEFTNAQKFKSK